MSGSRIDLQHFEPYIKIKNDAGSEDIHYFSLYEGLPAEFKQYALEHLNETDENKEKGLCELKAFMQRENLGSVDDLLILAVLRNCKYDIKKSMQKLKRFLKQRLNVIDDLTRVDMKNIEAVMDDVMSSFLPYRDKHGRLITYTRPNFHFENYTMPEVVLVGKIMILFYLRYPMTTVMGTVYIADNQWSRQVFCSLIRYSKTFIHFLVDCPIRIGRTDSIHSHFLTRLLENILSPFVSDKLKSRTFLHSGGYEVLENVYHPSLRPEELGGTAGRLTNSFYRDKVMKFIQELKYEGAARSSQRILS